MLREAVPCARAVAIGLVLRTHVAIPADAPVRPPRASRQPMRAATRGRSRRSPPRSGHSASARTAEIRRDALPKNPTRLAATSGGAARSTPPEREARRSQHVVRVQPRATIPPRRAQGRRSTRRFARVAPDAPKRASPEATSSAMRADSRNCRRGRGSGSRKVCARTESKASTTCGAVTNGQQNVDGAAITTPRGRWGTRRAHYPSPQGVDRYRSQN
jgi:hypothetical protein